MNLIFYHTKDYRVSIVRSPSFKISVRWREASSLHLSRDKGPAYKIVSGLKMWYKDNCKTYHCYCDSKDYKNAECNHPPEE